MIAFKGDLKDKRLQQHTTEQRTINGRCGTSTAPPAKIASSSRKIPRVQCQLKLTFVHNFTLLLALVVRFIYLLLNVLFILLFKCIPETDIEKLKDTSKSNVGRRCIKTIIKHFSFIVRQSKVCPRVVVSRFGKGSHRKKKKHTMHNATPLVDISRWGSFFSSSIKTARSQYLLQCDFFVQWSETVLQLRGNSFVVHYC